MNTPENNLEQSETVGLKSIIVSYLRQWKVFLCVFILSFIPAILYLILMPKTYEMQAALQLQEEDMGTGGSFGLGEAAGIMKSFGLGSVASGSIRLEDEMAILNSNQLMRKVIRELDLQVEYTKPGTLFHILYKDSPLLLVMDSITSYRIADQYRLEVKVSKGGTAKIKVTPKEDGKSFTLKNVSLPATIKLNEGEVILKYNDAIVDGSPAIKMDIRLRPYSWVAEDLAEEVEVEDVSKSSNTILLAYQDHEKQRGLDILYTMIDKYNEQVEEKRTGEARKSLRFINSRIQDLLEDLYKTEVEIEKYKTLHGMTDMEYDIMFYVGQMQELQTKIIELEAQTQIINLMDEFVKDPANKYNLVPMLISTGQEGGGEGSPLAMYNLKLLERSQYLNSSSPNNPMVKLIEEQLDQLRESVFLSITNTRESIQIVIADLKSKENLLYDKMASVPSVEREYINFRRQQEIFQGVYLLLLQKREELELSVGVPQQRAHVVDPPFILQKKVGPRKLFAALGMIIFTLIVPVIWIEGKKLLLSILREFKNAA